MHKKTKSALVVFLFMAVAFAVVGVFDYTDNYVGDRFRRAVEDYRVDKAESFSLDAFMEHYDWDAVCIVLPGSDHEFKTRAGTAYKHKAIEGQTWSLVFTQKHYVIAEVPVERSFLAYPNDLEEYCFDRWHAVFRIVKETDGRLRLEYLGH